MAACRAALEVRTRQQFPQAWAATQNNLANVLSDLGERASGEKGVQYLQESVEAIEKIAKVA